jgi:hypothetical protein
MKRIIMAMFALAAISFVSCRKNTDLPATPEQASPQQATAESATPNYDFVINVKAGCAGAALTINDCGDASYKIWNSTTNCSGANSFNGTVFGSGNPLLLTNPPTFPTLGVTYNIFDNSTTATRDVLSITFYPGYNASHKPTISYNASTRKFTIVNAGNPTYVSVTKFSYTGLIASGVIEFC